MVRKSRGFTIPELIVVMAIAATVFGMASVSLIGAQRQSSVAATVMTLTADIRNQQLKAMAGETQSGVLPDGWGIHFNADSYVLFPGTSYDPSGAGNVVVPIDGELAFDAIAFPGATVVFAKGSGDVAAYDETADTVRIRDINAGLSKTIEINRYGAVSGMD